jgi:hypothetical protein
MNRNFQWITIKPQNSVLSLEAIACTVRITLYFEGIQDFLCYIDVPVIYRCAHTVCWPCQMLPLFSFINCSQLYQTLPSLQNNVLQYKTYI